MHLRRGRQKRRFFITGNVGVGDATISDGTHTFPTDSAGNYRIKVKYGENLTLTPTLDGYAFTPESRSYTNVLADISGEDYTAGW